MCNCNQISFLDLLGTPDTWGDPGSVPIVDASKQTLIWSSTSSPTTFVSLTDVVPGNFTGSGNYIVGINPGETGVEFYSRTSLLQSFDFTQLTVTQEEDISSEILSNDSGQSLTVGGVDNKLYGTNLGSADQTLAGARQIIGGANTLTMTGTGTVSFQTNDFQIGNVLTASGGTLRLDAATAYEWGDGAGGRLPTVDSDATFAGIFGIGSTGTSTLANVNSLRSLTKTGVPGASDTAFFTGQITIDDSTNKLYYADTKSTNPDSAAAGASWTELYKVGIDDVLNEAQVLSTDRDLRLATYQFDIGLADYLTGGNKPLFAIADSSLLGTSDGGIALAWGDQASGVYGGLEITGSTAELSFNINNSSGYEKGFYATDTYARMRAEDATGTMRIELDLTANEMQFSKSVTDNYTWSIPTFDSDASNDIMTLTGAGVMQMMLADSFRIPQLVAAPSAGTTVAYYTGQFQWDQTNKILHEATAKSSNPDSGGAGSTFAVALFQPYQQTFVAGDWTGAGPYTLSITQATHGRPYTANQIYQITLTDSSGNQITPTTITTNQTTGDVTIVHASNPDGRIKIS